ncbi:CDK-activating kinase assembly factor MAT1-like [Acanthaster planci]|uniref:CDK-activating kinase assembly factor MAT1 n=1 Tax=Acanthaster planci TaxID=133434 RepID=A0A8B7ZQC9_ACAPL|nr:CDK-activating kinase assembly factor MAT1-like [Acanthaster planci]
MDLMDEQACPRCKSTKFRNPALKLLVNVCGHTLCENCVEILFVRGSGACPSCNTPLRKNQFRVQEFEDAYVEKEVDIRKRILKDFNQQEDDFPTLREYNDYLEEVETIIFNLTNGIDVEATKKKVELYRKQNRDRITRNRSKQSSDQVYLEALIQEEREEQEEKRQQLQFLERQTKNQKKRDKEALIDELIYSDMPADHVIASHTVSVEKQEAPVFKLPKKMTTSAGIRVGLGYQDTFLPVPKQEEVLYAYEEEHYETYGPSAPTPEEIDSQRYNRHVRPASPQGEAGGYGHNLACLRALQEAFSGLLFFPSVHVKDETSVMETS